MEKFFNYIEESLPDRPGDAVLYRFKKKILDEMTARANELTARGLHDKDVMSDLIISEYADIGKEYQKYENEKLLQKKRKRRFIGNIIGSVVYIIALVVVFLAMGFAAHIWHPGWVVIVDGILFWIAYILFLGINRVLEMKRIFHFVARLMLAIAVIVIFVALFLFALAVLGIPHAWVIVFMGLFSMFLADALFASLTRQKLVFINWLIYIPAMSAMLYIVLGGLSVVAWSKGWSMIPLSLIIDVVIMYVSYKRNKNIKHEVIDAWKES